MTRLLSTLRQRKLTIRSALRVSLLAGLLACGAPVSEAGARGLIRDSEIEALIADYATPILQVALPEKPNIRIHLVNDPTFNAFVVDGNNMFIHTGAIQKSATPNQIIGVIAHEAGHIEGAHIARMHTQIERAQAAALWFQLLGIAAIAGGAASGGGSEVAQGGAAVIAGGQSAVMRSFLMYRRSEEYAADQAAVKYLNATRQSARGMLETFRLFAEQSLAAGRNIDPYVQSHPMPQDRIATLEQLARTSPYFEVKDPPELQLRHDMVRAKLDAFLNRRSQARIYRDYPPNNKSLPARYARAIAACYGQGARAAMPLINELIAEQPNNPYFHEFKGQCLIEEGGNMAEAIPPLRRAVELAPRAPLIRVMLAQALLGTNNNALVNEAIAHLKKALERENTNVAAYIQLANAYGRINRIADAELATAFRYLYTGRINEAKSQAKRAQAGFPMGSPEWYKADDIINTRAPKGGG